jgi:cobalt-zinc-cadmium efflux system membrane fusion protein
VPVNALGSGRVVELRATLGDQVRRGQTLVTINSPDVAAAQAERLRAAADEDLARKQLDRARVLFEHGSIARKDLEAAEDAEQKAQIDLHATEERVRMLGGDPAHAASLIELRAPIDGTIVEQNVTPSAGVKSPDNAPNLFTIADLSRVWVLCDVYENELSEAQVGHLARIRLNAYPDRVFIGHIGNVSRVLDPSTRTAKVRIELDNSSGAMRPGMFASGELESPTPRERLVLPTTAIVQVHDANWVFIRIGAAAFRRVPVQTAGEAQPGEQIVTAGVAAGEQVVRNALQFMQTVEQ